VAGPCRKGRAEAVLALLKLAEAKGRIVLIGLPEIELDVPGVVSLPASDDGYDIGMRIEEAYALGARHVAVSSPVMTDTPTMDILSATFESVIWAVPASTSDKALRAIKNMFVFQAASSAEAAAQFLYDSVGLAVTASHAGGAPEISQVEQVSGIRGSLLVTETKYKK
jgi:hypothetical protein